MAQKRGSERSLATNSKSRTFSWLPDDKLKEHYMLFHCTIRIRTKYTWCPHFLIKKVTAVVRKPSKVEYQVWEDQSLHSGTNKFLPSLIPWQNINHGSINLQPGLIAQVIFKPWDQLQSKTMFKHCAKIYTSINRRKASQPSRLAHLTDLVWNILHESVKNYNFFRLQKVYVWHWWRLHLPCVGKANSQGLNLEFRTSPKYSITYSKSSEATVLLRSVWKVKTINLFSSHSTAELQ